MINNFQNLGREIMGGAAEKHRFLPKQSDLGKGVRSRVRTNFVGKSLERLPPPLKKPTSIFEHCPIFQRYEKKQTGK